MGPKIIQTCAQIAALSWTRFGYGRVHPWVYGWLVMGILDAIGRRREVSDIHGHSGRHLLRTVRLMTAVSCLYFCNKFLYIFWFITLPFGVSMSWVR